MLSSSLPLSFNIQIRCPSYHMACHFVRLSVLDLPQIVLIPSWHPAPSGMRRLWLSARLNFMLGNFSFGDDSFTDCESQTISNSEKLHKTRSSTNLHCRRRRHHWLRCSLLNDDIYVAQNAEWRQRRSTVGSVRLTSPSKETGVFFSSAVVTRPPSASQDRDTVRCFSFSLPDWEMITKVCGKIISNDGKILKEVHLPKRILVDFLGKFLKMALEKKNLKNI